MKCDMSARTVSAL